MLVGIFALVISAHYSFLVYTGIFIVILYILRHYYLPASRSLKRLDGSSKILIFHTSLNRYFMENWKC